MSSTKWKVILEPVGIGRHTAAAYIGISETKFDELVKDGRMPLPRVIDGRRVWVRNEVEQSFLKLPTPRNVAGPSDPWHLAA